VNADGYCAAERSAHPRFIVPFSVRRPVPPLAAVRQDNAMLWMIHTTERNERIFPLAAIFLWRMAPKSGARRRTQMELARCIFVAAAP